MHGDLLSERALEGARHLLLDGKCQLHQVDAGAVDGQIGVQ